MKKIFERLPWLRIQTMVILKIVLFSSTHCSHTPNLVDSTDFEAVNEKEDAVGRITSASITRAYSRKQKIRKLRLAKSFIKAAQYERVIKELSNWQAIDRELESRRLFRLGYSLAKLNRYADSSEQYLKVRSSDKLFLKSQYNIICNLALSGRPKAATSKLSTFKSTLERYPKSIRERYQRLIQSDPDLVSLNSFLKLEKQNTDDDFCGFNREGRKECCSTIVHVDECEQYHVYPDDNFDDACAKQGSSYRNCDGCRADLCSKPVDWEAYTRSNPNEDLEYEDTDYENEEEF